MTAQHSKRRLLSNTYQKMQSLLDLYQIHLLNEPKDFWYKALKSRYSGACPAIRE